MENQIFLEWQSPEHQFNRKKSDWYWILGIITLATAVLAFYFNNFLFGVFILIAGGTLGFLSYQDTKTIEIKITLRGVISGRFLHPWSSYRSFWIDDEHTQGYRLLLRPVNSFLPLTIIPISDEVDLDEVQDILLEFLDEEFLRESVVHRWFDNLMTKE